MRLLSQKTVGMVQLGKLKLTPLKVNVRKKNVSV